MKRKIVSVVFAVTVGMLLSACSLFSDTTDSVFDDGENAIASNRAASRIETAEFVYEFDNGRGTALVRYQAPNHVRIDVLDGEQTMVYCLNGSSGWMYVLGDVIDMTPEDIAEMHAALLQAIPFNVNFQDLFRDAELKEETEFACGEECRVIHATLRRDESVTVTLWFGDKSDLLRQLEVVREDGVNTMQYFDYREFDDVTLPAYTFRFSDEGASKITLISFEANEDIPAYVFRKPERLSAMQGGK